jgi:DNA-binding transcriptional LysR family regulator
VELRELEIFLVLGEELHFGRTAERLYLTQPRVSQTIRTLEERIGGRLFERTSRRVSLTPLGERLRDELRPGYDQIQRAVVIASDLAKGVSGVLRMCVPTYSMAGPSFTEITRTFQTRYPACRLVVAEEFPGDFGRLRQGAYDLMCHRQPISEPDLTVGRASAWRNASCWCTSATRSPYAATPPLRISATTPSSPVRASRPGCTTTSSRPRRRAAGKSSVAPKSP